MNDVTIFIYLVFFVSLCGATFAFMWRMTGAVLQDVRKPPRTVHPEMKDVQNGEELLVFKVKDDNSTDYNS
tara:strand:+ start:3943 stop:4155 length:213 start_codon:yes stop_codon:yes gene_type:complete